MKYNKLDGVIYTARYYNSSGIAVAIVAIVTPNVDWAAYIGGTSMVEHEEDTYNQVADHGCKLSERDAQYYFPNIDLPYRE